MHNLCVCVCSLHLLLTLNLFTNLEKCTKNVKRKQTLLILTLHTMLKRPDKISMFKVVADVVVLCSLSASVEFFFLSRSFVVVLFIHILLITLENYWSPGFLTSFVGDTRCYIYKELREWMRCKQFKRTFFPSGYLINFHRRWLSIWNRYCSNFHAPSFRLIFCRSIPLLDHHTNNAAV